MSEKIILVPVDFTTVSEVCVSHAYATALKIGAEIHLLHLVDDDNKITEKKAELEQFLAKMQSEVGSKVPFHLEVIEGDILKDIGAKAEDLNAVLVVMGTHGLQGLEYIVGTHAVRILATAQVPFIVVQERPIRPHGYKNIIVPMDLRSESKQKLEIVAQMANYFDSMVHIIIAHEKDEFLQNALKRNLKYAESFFKQKGIEITTTMSPEDNNDLDDAVLHLAAQKDADLIAIVNDRENRVLGIFGSDLTQEFIINKAMIPILSVNPKVISNFDLFGSSAVYN